MEVRFTGHKFENWPPKDHSCHVCFKLTNWFQRRRLLNIFFHRIHVKVTIQLAWWFLTRRFLKFQPMRTHYGSWQPCWISNQHQKHKSGRGPSNEHVWQVWLKSVQQFQRSIVKCEKLTDGPWTLIHDKSSHVLWPGELTRTVIPPLTILWCSNFGIQVY